MDGRRTKDAYRLRMEPSEVLDFSLGEPIWVWIVRLGRGRWWPGTVESFSLIFGIPQVNVRFEIVRPGRRNSRASSSVEISTTRMRFLERRDPNAKGSDRPRRAPVALLRVPETALDNVTAVELNSRLLGAKALSAKASSPQDFASA